jgi:hypothetical protein
VTRLLLIALLPVTLLGELIPAARNYDHQRHVTAGALTGGRPTNRTTLINVAEAPYSADTNGVSNASTAIQNAVTAAAVGDAVYLPAGTYRLNSMITLKSGITLRGAGISNTFVKPYGAAGGFGIGSASAYDYPAQGADTIHAGATIGSTNITINEQPNSTWVNLCLRLSAKNDTNQPVISARGFDRSRSITVRVMAVNAGTSNITFWPPLPFGLTNTPVYKLPLAKITNAWLESLTVDATNSTYTGSILAISEAVDCGFYRVEVKQAPYYAAFIGSSVNCEMEKCYLNMGKGNSPNGWGIGVANNTGALIEDNVFNELVPNVEMNYGSHLNIFGYNYLRTSTGSGVLDVNHGAHNSFNLVEGNVGMYCQSDGYHGSSSEEIIFRNWFHSMYPDGTSATIPVVKLNRWTRNATLIANLLGNGVSSETFVGLLSLGKPNIGNESWTGYGPPWTTHVIYSDPVTFTQSGTTVTASAPIFSSAYNGWTFIPHTTAQTSLGTFTYISTTQGTVTTSQTLSSPKTFGMSYVVGNVYAGSPELDTNVFATTLGKNNYYYTVGSPTSPANSDATYGNPTNIDVALGGDTVPASLYMDAQPSFLTGYGWPPIDRDNPPAGTPEASRIIPAIDRYLGYLGWNDDDEPAISGQTPVKAKAKRGARRR